MQKQTRRKFLQTLYHIERCSFTTSHDLSALNPINYWFLSPSIWPTIPTFWFLILIFRQSLLIIQWYYLFLLTAVHTHLSFHNFSDYYTFNLSIDCFRDSQDCFILLMDLMVVCSLVNSSSVEVLRWTIDCITMPYWFDDYF